MALEINTILFAEQRCTFELPNISALGNRGTCENFIDALSKGSNLDLTIFKKWYSQPGTPTLNIRREITKSGIKLNFSQQINNKDSSLPVPIKISFINEKGNPIKFKINNSRSSHEHVYLYTAEQVL